MLAILFAGLVAELVMLPALLAGPLGRFCNPRVSNKRSPADRAAPAEKGAGGKPATDAEPAAGKGFAQPHITGQWRPTRDGAVIRRDRGHDIRGR
jgi:hypothetical protein